MTCLVALFDLTWNDLYGPILGDWVGKHNEGFAGVCFVRLWLPNLCFLFDVIMGWRSEWWVTFYSGFSVWTNQGGWGYRFILTCKATFQIQYIFDFVIFCLSWNLCHNTKVCEIHSRFSLFLCIFSFSSSLYFTISSSSSIISSPLHLLVLPCCLPH
jgi:hypothetical protein